MDKLEALEELKRRYETKFKNLENEIETISKECYIACYEIDILTALSVKDEYYAQKKSDISKKSDALEKELKDLKDEKEKIWRIIQRIDFDILATKGTIS